MINLHDHLPIESPIKNLTAELPIQKVYHAPPFAHMQNRNPLPSYGPNYSSHMRIVGPPVRQTFSQPIPQQHLQYQPFSNVFSRPMVQ